MAECTYCKSETKLYDNGVPICPKCLEARIIKRKPPQNTDQIRTALVSQIVNATARVSEANQKFSEAVGHFPSGLPHPDGVQRIKNASNELTSARKEMMTAHKRLNEFIEHGIVPEDLKRSG
jgi:hypothetical protein